mmetsp:Transcript_43354/g.130019  ORF Transcript_43354/g.130019 Transcript_43354/m.130019 type:complete len:81 (+) Transcript_43354:474-716(+)|eukprot:364753-Chlamydomonas_euryale.AAC.11
MEPEQGGNPHVGRAAAVLFAASVASSTEPEQEGNLHGGGDGDAAVALLAAAAAPSTEPEQCAILTLEVLRAPGAPAPPRS